MPAVHQLLAGLSPGDAISNEARALQADFRAAGFTSDLFCDPAALAPALAASARSAAELPTALGPHDVTVLHLAIGSPVNDLFPHLPGRHWVRYHNITPPEHFRAVNPDTAIRLALGRQQASRLAAHTDLALAASAFNAVDLQNWGYRTVRVLPLRLDLRALRDGPADSSLAAGYRDGLLNILFVGRAAPNKGLEEALRIFAHLQRHIEPAARFIHIGSYSGVGPYVGLLHALKLDLGLEHVDFLGPLPDAGVRAGYRVAAAFLCASRHEGFGIPLLEAMAFDVPVLAREAGAVAETLDGAGVLFRGEDPRPVAELLHRLARPGPLREAVLTGQRERLNRWEARDLAAEWVSLLTHPAIPKA
jgi:glycosyltransferase involved in cell wall biosynthesis